MGSNYLGREAAAGTCLDTLQLEAVGFGTELLIYLSLPPPPPPSRLAGKKSPSLLVPLRPHLRGVSHFSVAGRSAARPRWPSRPWPSAAAAQRGGRPAGWALPLAPGPSRPWVLAAAGEGGGRQRVTDVLL